MKSFYCYRMLRAPILERKKWWDQVPVKHLHTYRRLPLDHSGAAGKVSDVVIVRCHDRSFPLRLKMFLPANRSQKAFSSSDSKEETAGWESAKVVQDIREALLNLADVLAELWPYDNTARVLQRVLHTYNYGAALNCSEAEKVKTMVEFCDTILRENACKAVEQETPLSYREAKERWNDITERVATNPTGQQQQQAATTTAGAGFRGGRGGQQRGAPRGGPAAATSTFRAGAAARGRGARFQQGANNYPVCFNYNRGNCGRAPKGCGCDDGRGGVFAHVCNQFDVATNRFCLQLHPRVGNH